MTKTQALKRASASQRTLNAAEEKATHAALARDQAVYDAQTMGATYAEIQDVTGLSTARITQVLRKVRRSTTTTDSGE